ncbi:hypothetical protein ES703_60066 [subsurface metagenome]
MKVWLTNERVAWQIPSGRIASFYLWGIYLPPEGWLVRQELGILFRLQQRFCFPLLMPPSFFALLLRALSSHSPYTWSEHLDTLS